MPKKVIAHFSILHLWGKYIIIEQYSNNSLLKSEGIIPNILRKLILSGSLSETKKVEDLNVFCRC